MVEEEQKQDVT